jgi:3-isopropylmalate dehydrogenase
VINPLAAIAALQMLLETVGEEKAAADVESAIKKTCLKMKSMSAGKMGMSTTEVGDTVAASV